MMTAQDALLADVIAFPDEDWPRLIFADWIEDHGDPERAEFVRVQCALAAHRPGRCAAGECARGCPEGWCELVHDLSARERELLTAANAMAWGPDLALWDADCERPFATVWGDEAQPWPPAGYIGATFRRGFVEKVTLPVAAWMEHGPALVRAEPLTRARLSDRTPNRADGEHERYYWWHADLPGEIYRLMACDDAQPAARRERPNWKRYPSEAAALRAFSGAALAWAKGVTP